MVVESVVSDAASDGDSLIRAPTCWASQSLGFDLATRETVAATSTNYKNRATAVARDHRLIFVKIDGNREAAHVPALRAEYVSDETHFDGRRAVPIAQG